jgi:hypothetical protein
MRHSRRRAKWQNKDALGLAVRDFVFIHDPENRPEFGVSDFAHEFIQDPENRTEFGVSEIVQSFVQDPENMPGLGLEVSDFVLRSLGGPDTLI